MFSKSKQLFSVFLSVFLFLSIFTFALSNRAEAFTLQVTNPYRQTLTVALFYIENSTNRWFVQGWYNVSPNSTRTLNFNNSTRGKTIWIHAYTSEASWGSEKKYTVIVKAFKYFAGETAPNGEGRRQVGFDKYYIENNGYVYYNP